MRKTVRSATKMDRPTTFTNTTRQAVLLPVLRVTWDRVSGPGDVLADGETHRYWVQYSPSKDALELNIDTTNVGNTPFSPYVAWNTPFILEFFGESIYQGTDTPGYSGNAHLFTNMQAQGFDDIWYPNLPSMTAIDDQSRFYLQNPIGDRTFYGYTSS